MASLGPLGPVLGASWALSGPSWGRLGAVSGPSCGHHEGQDVHRKRKSEKPQHFDFLKAFEGFMAYWGGCLRGSRSTRNPLGAVLGRLGGMSEAILRDV
eukprot:2382688-Pyramimonas_sp.AAC.1